MGLWKTRTVNWLARSSASVAIVLRPGPNGTEVLLTRRAKRVGDPWSGHVSFPGGRAEPGEDAVATAVRETREELALDLSGHQIGRLDSLMTFEHGAWAGMSVEPILFWVTPPVATLTPNHEVAQAFWVPLAAMRSGELKATRPWRLLGRAWAMPAWDWQGHIIWGLTYRMLGDLLRDL